MFLIGDRKGNFYANTVVQHDMKKETEIIYRKPLKSVDFKDWFIQDFGLSDFEKIELVKKKVTYTYPDERMGKSEYINFQIEIEVRFSGTVFLNRTMYFNVHYIDFAGKKVSGYVFDENLISVLNPEACKALHISTDAVIH